MQTADGASTREVLVKFAAKYNEATHRLLATYDPPSPQPYTPVYVSSATRLFRSLRAGAFGILHYSPTLKWSARTFPEPSVCLTTVTSFLATYRKQTCCTCRITGVTPVYTESHEIDNLERRLSQWL